MLYSDALHMIAKRFNILENNADLDWIFQEISFIDYRR